MSSEAMTTERARHAMREWQNALGALRDLPWPALALNVESEDEVSWVESITCPHCSAKREPTDAFVSVDTAERWTSPNDVDLDAREVTFHYDGSPEWDGLTYLTACCVLPVSLPEGWTEWA